jgi:phosphoribosylanthranilate isomerase
MTRIKICGITNLADARAAISFGADALGFIGVPSSPRYITPETFAEIEAALPPYVGRVAVVQRPEDAAPYAADYVQYYEESTAPIRAGTRHIRCFRMKDESSLAEIKAFALAVTAFHLDTYHKDKLGGSGEVFNWDLAVEAMRRTDKPIILAGGLVPENVAEAVRAVRPYAVDVSSGVEAEPGRKDHEKLRAFIEAVRNSG